MPTELLDLTLEEVSAVDRPANPGARVVLMKREGAAAPAHAQPEEQRVAPTATEALAKALAPDAADGRTEAEHKAVLKAGLERGLVSAERATAELMLESLAKTAHRADPDKSFEQHYVRQLAAHPEIAALLD